MVWKMPAFKTNVVTGPALLALSENVRGWQKRDCCRQLSAYLHSAGCDRVCLLFGLRRTGKTTLLRQAVLDMTPEDAAKTAYVKATKQDTIADLNRDICLLYTSDAADDGYSVDLGGRRIIKKIFFKQKTAYEISEGLVGSEMCIRDSTGNGLFHQPHIHQNATVIDALV